MSVEDNMDGFKMLRMLVQSGVRVLTRRPFAKRRILISFIPQKKGMSILGSYGVHSQKNFFNLVENMYCNHPDVFQSEVDFVVAFEMVKNMDLSVGVGQKRPNTFVVEKLDDDPENSNDNENKDYDTHNKYNNAHQKASRRSAMRCRQLIDFSKQ